MSELIKKAAKEATAEGAMQKLLATQNIFLIKPEGLSNIFTNTQL